ncbi:MAG: magnesium transporter [Phycisphaerales bacterium]
MLGHLIQVEVEDLIARRDLAGLREIFAGVDDADIAEILIDLPPEDEGILFRVLPKERAGAVFSYLPPEHQAELVTSLSSDQMIALLDAMTPDDRVSLLDDLPAEVTRRILDSLSPQARAATRKLLGYPADTAGHVMTPEYVALRPEMTGAQALDAIRRSERRAETMSVLYVVDEAGRFLFDLRLGKLVKADPEKPVAEIEHRAPVSIPARTELSEVVRLFKKYDRTALPVVDDNNCILGIITADDVLDISQTEETETQQRFGGLEAIDTPYARTPFTTLLRKRGGWLSLLFLGEMLTASAMGHFEAEIQSAVVLALFIPLVISSGGNSGSQAATLIVRSLALGELQLRDWWRVASRELGTGVMLGAWLGLFGFARVLLWQWLGWSDYGEHALRIAITVWISLVGVVCFGTMAGSMLPFLLRRLRLDPATSSAPFVATLVDVTGLIIYFSVAALVLRGALL